MLSSLASLTWNIPRPVQPAHHQANVPQTLCAPCPFLQHESPRLPVVTFGLYPNFGGVFLPTTLFFCSVATLLCLLAVMRDALHLPPSLFTPLPQSQPGEVGQSGLQGPTTEARPLFGPGTFTKLPHCLGLLSCVKKLLDWMILKIFF